MKLPEILHENNIEFSYASFSALDEYFRLEKNSIFWIKTTTSLSELATVIPALSFPGIHGIDAEVHTRDRRYFLITSDSENVSPVGPPLLDFYYDPVKEKFLDPSGIYSQLRLPTVELNFTAYSDNNDDNLAALRNSAVLLSRYGYSPSTQITGETHFPNVNLHEQSHVEENWTLTSILTGNTPWKGLSLLEDSGYIEANWPELHRMNQIDHSKEHHPEGNVWAHSLESLKYRKTRDLALSLAILFHDCGKPVAPRQNGKRFDQHAEIGKQIAHSLLTRIGFPARIIDEVDYLIRWHMMPGALSVLPVHKFEDVMASPFFPKLLELYRCDLSSTFRGPDGYYEACRIYRNFLRNVKNPFRQPGGRKVSKRWLRMYVE